MRRKTLREKAAEHEAAVLEARKKKLAKEMQDLSPADKPATKTVAETIGFSAGAIAAAIAFEFNEISKEDEQKLIEQGRGGVPLHVALQRAKRGEDPLTGESRSTALIAASFEDPLIRRGVALANRGATLLEPSKNERRRIRQQLTRGIY